jgi:cytochrome P450
MMHDEKVWPEPFEFSPERYLGPNPQRNPREVCFGFGRRICPGMYLAQAGLSMAVVMSLAVFNITNALDENGVPIIPKHENTSGTIRYVMVS